MATRGRRELPRTTSQMAANIKDLIDSFPTAIDKAKVLQSLKIFISKCPRKQLQEDLANVDLQKFFATFPTLNEEAMALCCEIIDSLFVSLNPEVVVESYSNELRQGLVVERTSIQLICLAELKRLPIELFEAFLIKNESAISSLIHLITCEPLQVALSAVSTLSRVGHCEEGPSLLFSKHLDQIKLAMTKNDVVRFRFYELFMNIASSSNANLHTVAEIGLLGQLISELFDKTNPDILAQMNCIELLTNLAMTDHGFVWLTKHRILDQMEDLVDKINAESVVALMLPGLLVFFGCLAKDRPKEICSQYKIFMSSLFTSTNSRDMTLRGIAFETLSHISSTPNGKLILDQYSSEMDNTIRNIGITIYDSATEVRGRALCSFGSLLELKPADQTEELLSLTEKWFYLLHDTPFKLVFSYCNQPFEPLRMGAHKVMLSLAYTPWGQTLMKNNPPFQEYLLDRKTEKEIDWKYSKFKIVEAMVECSFTEEIFGTAYYKKLVEHIRAGPNYVECESAVALEDGS